MESKFKNQWEDFGSKPSQGLWDRIEETLDEKKKRKPLLIWFYYGLSACFIAVLATQMVTESINGNQTAANQTQHVDLNTVQSNLENSISTDKVDKLPTEPKKKTNINQQNHQQREQKKSRLVVPNKEDEVDRIIMMELIETTIETTLKPNDSQNLNTDSTITQNTQTNDSLVPCLPPCKKQRKNRFELGLTVTIGSSLLESINLPTTTVSQYADISNSIPVENSISVPGNYNYRIYNPLNIHIKSAYYFSERWRLDAELGYSRFQYRITNESDSLISRGTYLSSFSIPLSVNYERTLSSSKHAVQLGAGLIQDISPEQWNSFSVIYYGTSLFSQLGYSYRFGECEVWRLSANINIRRLMYENRSQASLLFQKQIYGIQLGVSRLL